MSLGELGVAALAAYLLALLAIAELARRARRDATPADHFLASRDLGAFVLFLTLYATAYSGNSLLGYPGRAYQSGFSFVMSTGFMMAIIVVFHALVPKLRPLSVRHGFISPGDYVRLRFGAERGGRALALAIGVSMAIGLANFLLAQLKAMGEVAATATGGAVPYAVGVAGLALLILFYETRGGMRAVAWTDAVQGMLMFVGLFALVGWLLGDAGGLANVTRDVARIRPAAVSVPSASVQANWFSTIGLLGIGSVLYPQAIQRIFAARDGRALKLSFAGMTFMPLATTLVVTLIGIAAIARLEGVPEVAPDQVMPLVLGHWAEAGGLARAGAVAVFIGALAAIMSTADSCLLSLGSVVARDVLGSFGADERATRMGKWIAAIVLLAMVPLALDRETTLWRLIELKMELLVQCAPAFLLGLHWTGLRAVPALAGFVAGTLFAVVSTLADVPLVGGVHVGMVGLALNVAIAVVGSRVSHARRA